MPKISNEAVRTFTERMNACMKRVGRGAEVDTKCIRRLVREEPETAVRVTEIFCFMAQSNPTSIRNAMILAAAYYVEFKDPSLGNMVHQKAKAAGAEKWLEGL